MDTGTRLPFIPSQIVAWQDFRQSFPDALVLSRDTGSARPYGQNPYLGYDTIGSSTLFLVREFNDERLHAKERVLTVELDGETVAFPFSQLSDAFKKEIQAAILAKLKARGHPGAKELARLLNKEDYENLAAVALLNDKARANRLLDEIAGNNP